MSPSSPPVCAFRPAFVRCSIPTPTVAAAAAVRRAGREGDWNGRNGRNFSACTGGFLAGERGQKKGNTQRVAEKGAGSQGEGGNA
jgi:ribosomal protein L18